MGTPVRRHAREKRRDELVSKVTAKAQTTLPSGVRKALAVGPGDSLRYRIEGHRTIIEKASPEAEEADPAVGAFLTFLAGDFTRYPERLRGMPRALLRRARALTRGISIEHEAPIEGAIAPLSGGPAGVARQPRPPICFPSRRGGRSRSTPFCLIRSNVWSWR